MDQVTTFPPASERLSVLVVEDNDADAELVREMLREANLVAAGAVTPELHHVDTLRAALDAATRPFDVALLDLGLPDATGLAGLNALLEAVPELPAVVLTGARDPSLAARALLAGAEDFLVKGEVEGELLLRALRFAVARHRHGAKARGEPPDGSARATATRRASGAGRSGRRVLLVEDSPGDVDLVRIALSEAAAGVAVEHVERLADALAYLAHREADAVLLDLGLPDAAGIECIERLRRAFPELPVVVLTSNAGAGPDAVRAGVQDYVVKGELRGHDLQRAIEFSIARNAHALRERELAQERAALAATQAAVVALRDANGRLAEATRQARAAFEREAAARAQAEQRERALGASERRYRALFENMREGFAIEEIVRDERGNPLDIRHLELNPAFERHTGLRAADVLGTTVYDRYPEAEREWLERYAEVARTGEPAHFQATFGPLGRWFEVSAHRTESGHVAVVFSDVTARRQAEEVLRSADRNKSGFLTMLSHELRNALAPIVNSLYIVGRAGRTAAEEERARNVIERQVGTMTRLVNDLLDLSRIARGKIELHRTLLDLRTLVAQIGEDHRGIAEHRGLRLVIEVPPQAVWVDGDATRLTQMLGNLLNNAAKFTPSGGEVTLAVEDRGSTSLILVRDTGAGVQPERLDHLFEPFYQAHHPGAPSAGGLGLGLSLVKGIAELHGGSVSAASGGPGAGAEFRVTLPVQAPPRGAYDPAHPLARSVLSFGPHARHR